MHTVCSNVHGAMKDKTTTATKSRQRIRVSVLLIGKPAQLFEQHKTALGFQSDAEAGRVLMTARLGQLRRNGALKNAA